jgi:polyamine oxidase
MPLTRRALLARALAGGLGSALLPRRARAAQGSFDDGTDAIPAPAAGPVERVVVVGAGLAGLAAAQALRNAGVEVVVVEGRERLGGRTWTADVGGAPVDLGAAWIHTPVGNPMSEVAQLAGVGVTPADPTDLTKLSGWEPEAGWLSSTELVPPLVLTQAFYGALPALRATLGPDASVADAIAPFLATIPLAPDSADYRRAAFALRLVAEQFESGPAEDLALAYYGDTAIEYGGTDVFPDGGYRPLVEWVAAGVDVRLGETVSAVAVGADGVSVTTSAGTHTGSHALVTVPLGVLKAGAIAFEPALPAAKLAAIDALGFGNFEKVVLRYDEAFWLDAGRTNFVHLSATPMEFPLFLDLTAYVGTPTLVALCSDGFAAGLATRSEEQAIAEVEAILATLFGGPLPARTHAAVSRWGADPFTRGAYTYVALGATPADFATLAAPVAGRLLFAGEHTSATRFGYADGALQTGVREAKRLLQRSSVLLPAPGALPLGLAAAAALALLARRRLTSG